MTTQQQYLRDAASLLGLTQKSLAERMGVPWATFEKWLAPEASKSFREMPQMAWRLVRTVIEKDALAKRLELLTNPPLGGIINPIPQDEDYDMDDDEFATSKRDILISEYLQARGIFGIEDAPDDMLDAAHAEADQVLGKGQDN